MRKAFMCSICLGGIIGGALFVDSETITYKTGKVTVDRGLRNMVLLREDIEEITWKWVVVPVATMTLKSGGFYKFLIFNKGRFIRVLEETKKPEASGV